MSKKRDKNMKDSKNKKDSNDTKHCKSKNANGKKWEPHSGYYSEEEKFVGQINQISVLYFKNYFQ